MRLGRKKASVAAGPASPQGKNATSPRQQDLETPFMLALGDLQESPEKVCV